MSIDKIFKDILKGKLVIVGIGNCLRGDDGLGPALIKRLQGRVEAVCIDAGTTPENFIGKVARENPDTVLIIDALDLGAKAGEYEVLSKDDLVRGGLNTHSISPAMFIDHLEQETRAKIYILAVQPKEISFGETLSDDIQQTINQLERFLTQSCTKHI